MTLRTATLGTLLRHLTETLDGTVEDAYARFVPGYRPRFTPIVRALLELGPASIRTISQHAGITHSAVSQTISQMTKQGLVKLRPGGDARERIVALTPAAKAIVPRLKQQWAATNATAEALDRELSMPLSELLHEAIEALERQSFGDRLASIANTLSSDKEAF